jgi:hypothetical protein
VTTTFSKRAALLLFTVVLSAGPLALFAAPSGAARSPHTAYQTSRKNAGTPNSTKVTVDPNTGVVISYGNKYITYNAPSSALKTLGQALFLQN